jgi:hypothetical protein
MGIFSCKNGGAVYGPAKSLLKVCESYRDYCPAALLGYFIFYVTLSYCGRQEKKGGKNVKKERARLKREAGRPEGGLAGTRKARAKTIRVCRDV